MNNKMVILALAATVCLGACQAPREYNRTAMNDKETVYNVRGDELGRDDVRKVQRSLAAQGYYKGNIDGIWGQQTSQAILQYQNVHQQSQTGMMTFSTLQEFGVQMDEDSYHARHK